MASEIRATGLRIAYLDGVRFAKAVVAGAGRVIKMATKLNEINVFPVADHDTGSNMAATMRALSAGAHLGKERSLAKISEAIADSGLLDARGNSGSILVELFYGLSDGFAGRSRVTAVQFAEATGAAAQRAANAISDPKEGTILTVLRKWANFLQSEAKTESDIATLMERSLPVAQQAVSDTTNELAVLGESHVVDAGAQGFFYFLEGVSDLVQTGRADEEIELEDPKMEVGAHGPMAEAYSKYRFCTECLVTGKNLDRTKIREIAQSLGDSLVVAGSSRQTRIHIHSDRPGDLFEKLSDFGELAQQKVEDMARQQEANKRSETQTIAIVTDTGCDLSQEMYDELNVHVIPHRITFGKRSYIADYTLTSEQFYKVLAKSSDHPQTSQPTPADYIRTYEFLSAHYPQTIGIHMSGKLSGTFQSGKQLATRISDRIEVLDCKTASVGQGILVLEAARDAQAGKPIQEILDGLKRRITNMKSFVCVETLKYLVRGGRIGRLKGLLGGLLGMKPIFKFDADGGLEIAGKTLRGRSVHDAMIEKVCEVASTMKSPRIGIAHGNAPKLADRYANEFTRRFQPTDILITMLSPVMGVHGGGNCMGIAVLDESA